MTRIATFEIFEAGYKKTNHLEIYLMSKISVYLEILKKNSIKKNLWE